MKKYGKKILFPLLPLIAALFFLFFTSPVTAAECDDMPTDNPENTRKKIECLANKVNQLGSQANTLKNQISQFDYQIKLTTLKITQTQAQIDLLGGRIDQLTTSLDELNKAFSSRAVETYKLSRFENNFFFVLSASHVTDATSRFHYLQKIADEDRNLLTRLQNVQTSYQGQKTDQETLQKQLQDEKNKLNLQKSAKNNLLAATRNDEVKYQSLLSQAKAQLAAFNRFVSTQGGATILSGQTKCNQWGCYYNQRDAEWGNIGMGGSSYSVASYGCLISSVSMVASHYGRNIKPKDIAVNSEAFVPSTGFLYHEFSVNGIRVSLTNASVSIMDSELSAGRPVIAGLYSGPDHFIVILRKEGDKYIMHDPFLENGSERPLTDKYNVSDIRSLRLVKFN
jgi:peptidoglycan hydrolase CwlO-like protein